MSAGREEICRSSIVSGKKARSGTHGAGLGSVESITKFEVAPTKLGHL